MDSQIYSRTLVNIMITTKEHSRKFRDKAVNVFRIALVTLQSTVQTIIVVMRRVWYSYKPTQTWSFC